MKERNPVRADHLVERRARRVDEAGFGVLPVRLVVNTADEMREHLRIRLRDKGVSVFANQLIANRGVVFDHAVVDECEFAALIEMRMRVVIRDLAVRRPARVTDPVVAARRLVRHQTREICDPPRALPRLDARAVYDGDTGRVIAAVFQAAQSIEKDGPGLRATNVTNNSAHGLRGRE